MSLSSREAYRRELAEIAREDCRIVCLELDLGGQNHPFEAAHPDRFFNMGIAELATIDIAAGLAKAGFIPFMSTFAAFAALRAAEGLKLAMGYMGSNVKVAAPYAGVAGAWFGATHHCLEDLAILQSIPGIRILAPYGEEETRRAVRCAAMESGPFYIRLGRNGIFHSLDRPAHQALDEVLWDEGSPLGTQSKVCLISVGEIGTAVCLQIRDERRDLPHAHLCSLDHKSLKKAILDLRPRFQKFLVVEEHRPLGGIGSSLALMMPDRMVYSHNCGESWPAEGGGHEELLENLGFGVRQAMAQIKKIERGSDELLIFPAGS